MGAAAKSRGSALWLGLGLVLVASLAALATLVAATLVASPPPSRPRLASISPPSRPRLSPPSAISPPPPSASRLQLASVCVSPPARLQLASVSLPSRLHLASISPRLCVESNRKGTDIYGPERSRFCASAVSRAARAARPHTVFINMVFF